MNQMIKCHHVLVAEDEYFIAQAVADAFAALGCVVDTLVYSVSAALAAIEKARPDLAVLDINLGGEMIFPAAVRLRELSVPFMFITGYAPQIVPGCLAHAPLWRKPFDADALAGAATRLLGSLPS